MPTRLLLCVLLAAGLLVGLLPAPDGVATSARRERVVPVFPGVDREEWRWSTPGGAPVAAQVVVVRGDAGHQIRSVLAQDRVPGLERVDDMGKRLLPQGAVAGINGGFWLNEPVGDPNSYLAHGGGLVSESETQGSSPRGTFAMRPDGRGLVDRVATPVELRSPTNVVPVTGVNRLDRTHPETGDSLDGHNAVYLYTPDYGGSVPLRDPSDERYRGPATVLPLPGLAVPASGAGNLVAAPGHSTVAGGSVAIPSDGAVAVGFGTGGQNLQAFAEGEDLRAIVKVNTVGRDRNDDWAEIAEGLAAGPLIVIDSRMTHPSTWELEGFHPDTHSNVRHPRSAVGVTAGGDVLFAAVDGRRPGHSAGATMAELAGFMLELGAVEAVSLDGGGSTHLVTDGITRNQLSGQPRPVASGLFVFHDYEFTATERLAGAHREATAARIALAGWPDGADEAVLASAGDFPDALAGGPLASLRESPLLLAQRDRVGAVTREALQALGVRRLTLLGGEAAISSELEAALHDQGFEVRRAAGTGRIETAADIARRMGERHERVFLASAHGFPDALSAAAPAGLLGAPILLTIRDRLPDPVRRAIVDFRPTEVVIAGGGAVVGPGIPSELSELVPGVTVTRLAGSDRYGTARAVNEWAAGQLSDLEAGGIVVARGDNFPDALAGGPYTAARRQLLMIVPANDIRSASEAAAYLDARAAEGLGHVVLLGGHAVLSSHQQWQLDQLATGE